MGFVKGKFLLSLFLGCSTASLLLGEEVSFLMEDSISTTYLAQNENITKNTPPQNGLYIEQNSPYAVLDILYWHARTSGTYYCYKTAMPYNVDPRQGEMYDLKFGWSLGFRIGAGYDFEHDNWGLSLLYSQFVTSTSKSVSASSISPVIPSQSVYLIDEPVMNAKSTGKIDRQAIDFIFSKEAFLSPYFVIKPYVGLETCWLDFSQKVTYSGGTFLGANSVYVTNISDFWGIGPELGIGSNWYIGNGFYVEGDLAASFVYGLFDVTYKDKISPSDTTFVNLKQQFHQFSPIMQFSLGLGWGTYVNQCKQFIDVSLAYEGEYWFRQNQTIQVFSSTLSRYQNVSEDISMHGATLSVKVHF